MSIWTNNPFRADADAAHSLAYGPSGGRLKMWLAGVGMAILPAGYGIHCLFAGRAVLPGQNGDSMEVSGPAAIALAVAYIAVGAFIHFHYFWGLHPKLYRWSDILKVLAVVVFIGGLGYAGYRIMV
jgi:hypothetical protein